MRLNKLYYTRYICIEDIYVHKFRFVGLLSKKFNKLIE